MFEGAFISSGRDFDEDRCFREVEMERAGFWETPRLLFVIPAAGDEEAVVAVCSTCTVRLRKAFAAAFVSSKMASC